MNIPIAEGIKKCSTSCLVGVGIVFGDCIGLDCAADVVTDVGSAADSQSAVDADIVADSYLLSSIARLLAGRLIACINALSHTDNMVGSL